MSFGKCLIKTKFDTVRETVTCTFKSPSGRETQKIFNYSEVSPFQVHEYLNNVRPHVQEIFPNLDADDRELFISGTGSEEWDEIFGEEEE